MKSFLLYYIMLVVHEYDKGYMVQQTIATYPVIVGLTYFCCEQNLSIHKDVRLT